MSSEPQTAATPTAWPVLSARERRVLGVLVEKAKTTPDSYPLSMNSLVTGSNQKTNREPLMNLADVDVEEALAGVQKKGLAIKITGSRVERWRHTLYEAWHVGKLELAVLAELLLRGPQTEGELRGRASRMEAIDDLDALRAVLRPLAERRLVIYLTPEGRRGTVLTHGFHSEEELVRLRGSASLGNDDNETRVPAAAHPPRQAEPAPDNEASLAELRAEIAGLKTSLTELQAKVAILAEQLQSVCKGLGL